MVRSYSQFINGSWHEGRGRLFERSDPFSGQAIYRMRLASRDDAELALDAARRAADSGNWPKSDRQDRADILRRFADTLEAEREPLGELESEISGAPLRYARNFIASAARTFRYFAGLACATDGDATLFNAKRSGLIIKEPAGVASLITPWNFPLGELSWKLAPALAAGCTVVLKPDNLTAATSLEAAKIFERLGLPEGVLNIIVGDVADIGDLLTADPRVDVVSFTGSTASGRTVMNAAAKTVKPTHLELGGKSALIISKNCDIELAAQDAAAGIFWHNGQVCTACSRLFVDEAIIDHFRLRFLQAAEAYRPGDPKQDQFGNGPLVSDEHAERVARAIENAVMEGGTLSLDGRESRGVGKNRNLIGPTLIEGLSNEAHAAQSEVFGPVALMIPFHNLEEAVRLANDTPFGLGAGIWSNDFSEVMQAIRLLKAGSIWVNGYGSERLEMPWGGVKQSGHGRELGLEGLRSFQVQKSIHISEP